MSRSSAYLTLYNIFRVTYPYKYSQSMNITVPLIDSQASSEIIHFLLHGSIFPLGDKLSPFSPAKRPKS